VIFFAIRRRDAIAGPGVASPPATAGTAPKRSPRLWAVIAAVVLILAAVGAAWVLTRPQRTSESSGPANGLTVLARAESGDLKLVVLAAPNHPRVGRSAIVIECRDARSGALVDVGTISVNGTMPMPGMAMTSGLRVTAASGVGRYELEGEFGMAGVWSFVVEWSGPRGSGRFPFELEVH
jgi:4-amino-4-deoxy-L-arabinose transferase-like glycosyltransferase